MAGVEESFRPIAEQKNLRLIIRCPDVVVESDVALLQRVIQNLVTNALRYTVCGGVIVAARRRGPSCLIDIVDTGPGIADSERDLVFEEFYRGKQAVSSEGGLGLGLSIVRRMASALGHPLTLRSRVGHGTTFRIMLPLTVGAADEAPPTDLGGASFANARILVIENDAATRTALTRLLQSWGLQVLAVARLSDGQADSDSNAPDLVVADYHLDDGALGLEAIAHLRGKRHDLPAIVVTADHSDAVEGLVLESGCELMHKPVKPAQLRSLLSYLLQSHADRAPR